MFERYSTVRVGNLVVSDWSSDRRKMWEWVWAEPFQRPIPFESDHAWMVANFSTIVEQNLTQANLLLEWMNRTLCDLIAQSVPERMSGLLNFTWTSESSLSFVTPCHPQPQKYALVSIEIPDGRMSAVAEDFQLGHLSQKAFENAQLYFADTCVEAGTVLIQGECRPCPRGAECPGGGRVWPRQVQMMTSHHASMCVHMFSYDYVRMFAFSYAHLHTIFILVSSPVYSYSCEGILQLGRVLRVCSTMCTTS